MNLETYPAPSLELFWTEANSDKFPFHFHFLLGILLLNNKKKNILNFANASTLTDC